MQWFAELSKSQRCGNDAQPVDPRSCLCDELVAMPRSSDSSTMTPYSWFGRVVQSLVVGALVAAASLWGAWSLFDVVWQSSQSLRENVSAFVMIPLVGLGIFIPPLVVLVLCLRLGAFVTILMWPKKVIEQGVHSVRATRVPTADAVADALAQHRQGIRVTATCPSCGVGITVERSSARVAAADAKIYLRCACGACGGQFPA